MGKQACRAYETDVGAKPTSPAIDALFSAHVSYLRMEPADPALEGRVGKLWHAASSRGQGMFWYYPIEDELAVHVCDLEFHEDASYFCNAPDFFSISLCDRSANAADPSANGRRSLVGHAWKRQSCRYQASAHEHLRQASVVLLPAGLRRMGLRCHCDPVTLSEAIAALDGSMVINDLATVLDEMSNARPSPIVARAYYESKATEALAVLLDWNLSRTETMRTPLRACDRSAVNAACRHLAEHIDRFVTTDELCTLTCMSASKLTTLFKAAQGMTPQEYARRLRMERASTLLTETDLPLSTVSAKLGFARQGSFSESFKSHFGVTPREYRRAALKDGQSR